MAGGEQAVMTTAHAATTELHADADEFNAAEIGAIAHLYRGEMYRSKIWRTRLDATTNWAVVTTGIAMSIAFSASDATPLPIVLVSFLVTVFWVLEARRYRLYDISRTRVRVLEANFYGPLLRGQGARKDQPWNHILADDYTGVYFHIGYLEALGRRLRRNYAWIFAVQVVSYWGKLSIHPTPLTSMDQLWARASVGPAAGSGGAGARHDILSGTSGAGARHAARPAGRGTAPHGKGQRGPHGAPCRNRDVLVH